VPIRVSRAGLPAGVAELRVRIAGRQVGPARSVRIDPGTTRSVTVRVPAPADACLYPVTITLDSASTVFYVRGTRPAPGVRAPLLRPVPGARAPLLRPVPGAPAVPHTRLRAVPGAPAAGVAAASGPRAVDRTRSGAAPRAVSPGGSRAC